EEIEAAPLRQHDVEEDEIYRFVRPDLPARGSHVADDLDVVGRTLQLDLDNAADIRLVINDQQAAPVGRGSGWHVQRSSGNRDTDSIPRNRSRPDRSGRNRAAAHLLRRTRLG